MNIHKYIRRWILVHLTLALKISTNLIQEKPFCSKCSFSIERLKELR